MAKGIDQRSAAYRLWQMGRSNRQICDAVGIGERTLTRWARGWKEEHKARGGDARGSDRPLAVLEPGSEPIGYMAPPRRTKAVPRERGRGAVDELEMVDKILLKIESLILAEDDAEHAPHVIASLGRTAKDLLEFRYKKLRPPTAADLAGLATEMGLGPTEFVEELKAQWSKRA